MHNSLTSRIIGFLASLILTSTAFLIIFYPDFFHTGVKTNITILLTLAILQFIIQAVCFLNIGTDKGTRLNLLIFVSTISIVIIIVVFSIWVMNHLNYNMM